MAGVEVLRHHDLNKSRPVQDGPGPAVRPPGDDARVGRRGQDPVQLGGEAVLVLWEDRRVVLQQVPRRHKGVVSIRVVDGDGGGGGGSLRCPLSFARACGGGGHRRPGSRGLATE